jgi:hypothetical protein
VLNSLKTHPTPATIESAHSGAPSLPRLLLHLEGLTVLVGAIAVYAERGWNGWLFAALVLTPDLSMLGYLVNARVGARVYNIVHTYALPAALIALGWGLDLEWALPIALIWLAHIGADRMLGYGLKYPTAFKDTHLQRV